MKFYKYTPALLDPKTLEETLIGRDLELDNLKRILKSAASGKSFSHPILIGPKGIGKSHMLRIIYHSVKGEIKTKGLNAFKDKYVPVIFSEEEYPGNITKFIRLILHYLKSEAGRIPPISDEISKAGLLHTREKELVFEYIKTFKKKTGKILLLLVDNLNDIIDRFTDEDQSSLRELLMAHDSILLVGAAPTLFDSIINHDRPLYNFFEIIWLKDLSFKDTVALLTRYAELEGKKELVKEFQDKEPKLGAIHELAGGNPRLILSLYHIIVEGDISSIENMFLKLLDELSPYFRERMKDLSEQQKEIIDVMARASGLLTPTEMAGRCQMPVNLINAQLKRLAKIGYVRVSKKHTKKVFYDFNERLFSLWRQMRVEAGRKRLGFIVKFLEMWFTKAELYDYLDKILGTIRERMPLDCDEMHDDVNKLWYLKEAIPEFKGNNLICIACRRGKYDAASKIIDQSLMKKPDDLKMLDKLACIQSKLEKNDEAVETYKKMVEIKPNDYDAWNNLGNTYGRLLRYDESIEANKKSIELKPDNHKAWTSLGISYSWLKKYDEAMEAFKKSIELKPDDDRAWGGLGHIFKDLGKDENAIEAYKKIIDINPNESDSWRIWYSIAWHSLRLKKYAEVIDVCKKSLEMKSDENCSWYIMGKAYYGLKDFSQALLSFKKAIEIKHCKDCTDNAWFNVCITCLSLFNDEGREDRKDFAIENLKESLGCFPYIHLRDKIFEAYATVFKNIVSAKKINLIKAALKEIELANEIGLLDFLLPFSTLVKYLETKDPEIIDRLRHEERIVIDDMLKMLGVKVGERLKRIQKKKTKMFTH